MSTDLAHRWVWKGVRDFSLASQVSQAFPDMAAFHYQQAAEKYLKAFQSLQLCFAIPMKRKWTFPMLVIWMQLAFFARQSRPWCCPGSWRQTDV